MLYIAVCVCYAACVFGAPASTDVVPLEKQQATVIPIVSQSDELEPNGTYHFSYETGNGIKREEIAYDKVVPKDKGRSVDSNEGGEDSGSDSDEIHVQVGSYSYTAPDGTLISVRYIADENGFQPIGDHIPRVPSATGSSTGEKSGRALKVADSAASASAPAVNAKSAEKPKPKSAAPDAKSAESSTTVASADSEGPTKSAEASTTEAANVSEGSSTAESASAEASTPEIPAEASTTESAKTTEAASTPTDASTPAADVSTPGAEATTPASDASTTAADVSTPAADASTPAGNQSTTNAEPSTTEAASTTTAAA